MVEKVYRRLPLRDLLTDAEKRARDLIDQLSNTVLARVTDLRDLSRPIRRKSHYPTLVALQNSLQKYLQSNEETEGMIEYLDRQLAEIREHARRERFNRG
jgi:hypothetical protein